MCKCKEGTVPVNRLTEEQCDYMMRFCKGSMMLSHNKSSYDRYAALFERIKQYKQNLKNRLP